MSPRRLRYLRVNDRPRATIDDPAANLPIDIEPLTEWYEFCQKLSERAAWDYELLTIDFNFMDDQSGPWFPLPGQDEDENDFRHDAELHELKWSDRLLAHGPNSGILIGVYLVAQATNRDIPSGIAFHTRFAPIVMQDMSSAMLATQMLLGSNAFQVGSNLKETMKETIAKIKVSHKDPLDGIFVAVQRFRDEFKRRAGVGNDELIRLWMEPTSLWDLLDLFRSVKTEEALDDDLNYSGVEFYERNGALVSLDVRSLFIDCMMKRDQDGTEKILTRLPLAAVKPAGEGQSKAGEIWQFIEALATPSNIRPVLDFFDKSGKGGEKRSVNEVIKRRNHRLIALIFAWLDLYAERWVETEDRSWDPVSDEVDGDFPTLKEQVKELLRLIDSIKDAGWKTGDVALDPHVHFIPLTGPYSISTFLRNECAPGSVLYRALRYDGDSRTRQLSQKSLTALQHLIATALRWGLLEERKDSDGYSYRIKSLEVPAQRPMRTLHADLAARLNFNVDEGKDPAKQLGRIVRDTPGFENVQVKDFLSSLEERPLPEHYKVLGWEFMDRFWRGKNGTRKLPFEAFPACLREAEKPSAQPDVLRDQSKTDRQYEEVARRQSILMRPRASFSVGDRLNIECVRRCAERVGGDYYRIKPETNDLCRVYIGDVCGKDLLAGFTLSEIHGAIATLDDTRPGRQPLGPDEILAQLDASLGDWLSYYANVSNLIGPSDRWATFICGTIDLKSNSFTFANAGHPSAIFVSNGSCRLLESQSRAIGILPGAHYVSQREDLCSGDRMVLYTDGLGDEPSKEMLDCIVGNRQATASDLMDALLKLVDSQVVEDDLTLVVVAID